MKSSLGCVDSDKNGTVNDGLEALEPVCFNDELDKIKKRIEQIELLNRDYRNLRNSFSFKLGRAITFIPRKIRDIFRNRK